MNDMPPVAQPTQPQPAGNGTRVSVGIYQLNVALNFDRPIQLFTLTPAQAHSLGRLLMKTGKLCNKKISQRKRELAKKKAAEK